MRCSPRSARTCSSPCTPTPEEILKIAAPADALLVTYAKITADMIRQMTRCRIISRFGIGVDNVDLDAATAAGIVVTKVPDYCIDEVSDHAMALLLALVRKIPASNAQVHAGRWEMKAVVPIHRLRGRRPGTGRFRPNSAAGRAEGEGVRPACDCVRSVCAGRRVCARRRRAGRFLDAAGAVGLHLDSHAAAAGDAGPLQHRRLQQDEAGAPTLLIPPAARSSTKQALAKALDAGQLAGAALDVMPNEPPAGSPLLGRENVIITPHTSFYSEESLLELQRKAAQEVADVLTGKAPKNPVNPQALEESAKRKA